MGHRASIGVLLTLLGIIGILAVLPTVGFSDVPHQISYQGRLTDVGGRLLGGDYLLFFSIYDVPVGGTALWSEYQTVSVESGIYNIHLGADPIGNPFSTDLFNGQRWLGVTVGTDTEMVPRQLLTSTPFAMRAAIADRVENEAIETIHLANNAVTIEKIADGSVTGVEIVDGSITAMDIYSGSGSGLDADTLDGQHAESFLKTISDYGRYGVASSLYEGTTPLTNKYVDLSGDAMRGRLTVSFSHDGTRPDEAIKGSLLGSSAVGAGIYGYTEGASINAHGLHGEATGSEGRGVYGQATNNGNYMNFGGYFRAAGKYGRGIEAIATGTGGTNHGGVFTADGPTGRGVYGIASGAFGTGVKGAATESEHNEPVKRNYGGYFTSAGKYGVGVYGEAIGGYPTAIYTPGVGGWFKTSGDYDIALYAESPHLAGYFDGRVRIDGNLQVGGELSKSSGSFKIDHPLYPANKYLSHSFVESPDMMNVYNGNVKLNSTGKAWIHLPEYFEELNKDFRYQLTCIGEFAQVYIEEKVTNNSFKIAGGNPGMEVSWQVTGIRQDAWANAHRIKVEVDKDEKAQGKYLNPELFGMDETHSIKYAIGLRMVKDLVAKEKEQKVNKK